MYAFDRIYGYRTVKQELRQIADILRDQRFYEKLGVSAPRGLLLHGEPGVGKSLMAQAVIEASGRKAFVCRKDQPNGDFVRQIKETFEKAMANAPSIVLLDNMDKLANGDERRPDAEEYVTVQACIDEAKGKEVFVLATVNRLHCLPRSLYRAGRFDRVIQIKAPRGKDALAVVGHFSYSDEDSQQLRTAQGQAVRMELERAYRKAMEILSLNREFLEEAAAALAEKKLLFAGDIRRIRARCKIVPVSI